MTDHVKATFAGAAQRRPSSYKLSSQMQVNELSEPNVRIRELKKDRVNFVLENVDLS